MKKNQISGVSFRNRKRRNQSYIDMEPPLDRRLPTGPFRVAAKEHEGDLLLFVPRNEIGNLINDLTGRYGYSHVAIDCGELDEPTNRRVMIEATVGHGVHYAFQDEYGKRPFVRISLRKTGINEQQFCECIHAKVGEKFDELEVFTHGIVDNPAKQICSDLVTVCLPQEIREEIARSHKRAIIHPLSAVKEERPGAGPHLFLSPNAFAEFLGAPRGGETKGPDQSADPHVQDSGKDSLLPKLWKWGDTLVTSGWKKLRR